MLYRVHTGSCCSCNFLGLCTQIYRRHLEPQTAPAAAAAGAAGAAGAAAAAAAGAAAAAAGAAGAMVSQACSHHLYYS